MARRRDPNDDKCHTSLYLSESLLKQVKVIGIKYDRSFSYMVEYALKKLIESETVKESETNKESETKNLVSKDINMINRMSYKVNLNSIIDSDIFKGLKDCGADRRGSGVYIRWYILTWMLGHIGGFSSPKDIKKATGCPLGQIELVWNYVAGFDKDGDVKKALLAILNSSNATQLRYQKKKKKI